MATKRKLIVTGQKPITKIKLKNGGEATLFEVFATDEHGGFIEESLRSFTELDVGQCLEYEIEPYNHRRYGMSYTLVPPKRETARRLRELEEAMEAVLRWAESKGFKSEPALAFRRQEAPTPTLNEAAGAAGEAGVEGKPHEPEPTPAQPNAELDEKYGGDDDVPWSDEDIGPPPEEPPPEQDLTL
jgi:hypothetical protein